MITLLLSLLLFLNPPQNQNNPLTLTVYPVITEENTRVRVHIDPHERNRHLTLEWLLYEGFPNSKYWQIDGNQSQRTFEYMIRFDESGEWVVKAMLSRSNGKQFVVTRTVKVLDKWDKP